MAHTCKCELSYFGYILAIVATLLGPVFPHTQLSRLFSRFSGHYGPSLLLAASPISSFPKHKTWVFAVRCLIYSVACQLTLFFDFFRKKPKVSAMTRATRTRHRSQRRSTIRMVDTCNRGGMLISCNRNSYSKCSSLTSPPHKLRVSPIFSTSTYTL